MRRLFITLLLAAFAIVMAHAATKPDFRYPKTVAKTAESDLKAALKVGDGEGIIDALVRYSLAWSSISEEHLDDITSRIEQVANADDQRPDVRALLLHLEAMVIEAHPNRWQHLDLSQKRDSLVEESLRDLPTLTQYPLSDYHKIIDFGDKPYDEEQLAAQEMLPTLAEFLVFHTREHGWLRKWNERKHYLRLVLEKERRDSIEQARVYRERQFVNITHPEILGSKDSLRLEVEYQNVDRVQIEVCELDDSLKKENVWRLSRKLMKDVATYEIALALNKRDTTLHQTILLPPLPYGRYVVYHSFTDRRGEKKTLGDLYSYDRFTVTDIEEVGVWIIDRKGQKRDDHEFLRLHLERESGRPFDALDPKDNNYKERHYSRGSGFYQDTVYNLQILSDRGLYRPGETIYYSAVLQGNTVDQHHLLPNRRIVAELQNTERKKLLADTLMTDAFGQVKGSFLLPSSERTGRFTLHFDAYVDNTTKVGGWQTVSVSEYKAPTFDIDLSESPAKVQYADSVFTLKGRVMTFSGVPVSRREVKLTLSRHSWWRSYGGGDDFSSHTVWTDLDGRFSLELRTPEVAGKNPSRHTYLTVKAVCTNAGGETQENEYSLMIEAEADKDEPEPLQTSEPHNLTTSQPQTPSDLTPEMIPDSTVLWIHEMFHNVRNDKEALVRIGTSVPDAYIYYIVSDARGTLKHGWLHYDKPGLHDFTYPMPQPAPLDEYPSERAIKIQFMAMRFGQVHTEVCNFKPSTDPDQIHIARQTFRDHLIPGGRETWTFRIEGGRLNQLQQRSRLMLGLYDSALDKLQSFQWHYDVQRAYRMNSCFDICGYYGGRSRSVSYTEPLDLIDPWWPELNLYGEEFFNVRTFSKGSAWHPHPVMKLSNEVAPASIPADAPTFSGIVKDEDGEPVIGAVITISGTSTSTITDLEGKFSLKAPSGSVLEVSFIGYTTQWVKAAAGMNITLVEEQSALEEVLVVGYGSQKRALATGATNAVYGARAPMLEDAVSLQAEEADEVLMDAAEAASSLANVKMREGQTRLTLWEPMLTTDEDGVVSITFDVPDQNTTWHMQALALSPWGSFAQVDTTLLAQRPLMVQPSLPRFVRQGDRMNLAGLVLNATDAAQQVTAMVEVYNPRSQQTIASRAIKFQLDKGGQQEVSLNLIVPDTLEQIAFRIRAQVEGGEYGGFGDGEQQMLPVLPAVSPVIETIPFYLNPGDSAFTIELPDNLPEGAKIEMEWCDNPIVYCLEALPSLMMETYPTSSSLAHRLFAYALSEQIVHRYPASLADSLMVQLQKLQNPDGGFSWIDYPERRSSLYATAEVLELFGELQQLGALSKLSSATLVNRALKYYDKQMTDYYFDLSKKNRKKLDVNYFSYYLYLRSLFPDQALSERSQKLFKEALKQSSDRWGELNLAGRAYVALALYRQSPKQQKLACGIVESLRQFSLTHPKRGMYWDQLEYSGYRWLGNVSQTSLLLQTFALIDPHTAELDQIRKWLLLEKQTNSWGNSSLAADAVYALLRSGSEWESGKQIEALKYDSLHDRLLLRDTLSTLRTLPSSTRMVYVPAASPDHPSWGAVYMQYAAPTRTASANSNEELSIQKQLLDANGNVLSLEDLANDSTLLQVGDRVTIRLRITTTREMSEVQVIDERASCFEPVDQLSGYRWGRELGYYQESLDQRTVFLIPRLPRGEHWITYDLHVTSPGQFALGLAKVQCQYAPMFNAHTEGRIVRAEKN